MTQPEAARIATYREVVDELDRLVRFLTESHNALNHLPDWFRRTEDGGFDFESSKRLLERAKSELRAHERASEINAAFPDDTESEDYVLCTAALRIDGYEYRDRTDLDAQHIIDHFIARSEWSTDNRLDLLATFFLMQRYLYKWGGEMLPRNSPEWRVFRSLFVETTDVTVPYRYVLDDVWREKWEYRIVPRLEFYRSIVHRVHTNTEYEV